MATQRTPKHAPGLIGLDWGSTSLRAYRFGADGSILQQRTAPLGVLNVPDRAFAAALQQTVGDWLMVRGDLPILASGMIGSTVGWREVPYLACPAGLDELAQGLRAQSRTASPDGLRIVPGLKVPGSASNAVAPDVMRGEETQVLGALAQHPELAAGCRMILPGTHAKWVSVDAGRIVRFKTYMTGEIFAVLRDHSILGRPARAAKPSGPPAPVGSGFERGVAVAMTAGSAGLAGQLFSVRTHVVMGDLAATDSLDYLSGLLIGDELRAGLADAPPGTPTPLALIGDAAICALYRRALSHAGQGNVAVLDEAASAGLWRLAVAAELIEALPPPTNGGRS